MAAFPASARTMIGTLVSRYRILSRIGEGGMGEVFLAHDPSLDRRVALKFLLPAEAGDAAARRRLVNEAQAAARLDHPFICKIYEVGDNTEHPFIAMEYVDGTTLSDRLRQGPLPPRDAMRLGAEIAEALDFAHTRGIVHRDLKPSNVMVAADGHVKVMDFGVAKCIATGEDDPRLTMTATAAGQISGTLSYMSPEQLRGLPVDGRSDVFAFGLLLYEMTSGVHPFLQSSPISTVDAILNADPPRLDEKRADVSPVLARIIGRCLEKDRERRYQSLREAQTELSMLADGTTSVASGTYRPNRRWRGSVAAAAIAVVVAGAGAALWTWPEQFGIARTTLAFKERDWILISDFENLTGDPLFDRSLRVALEVGIAQSQYVNVLPPQRVDAALQRMQRAPGDRLDEPLAAEVAVREGVRAVLSCSIAQVGGVYSLTARVIDPQSRAAVLTESVEATDKEHLLPALGELATTVRRRLGESLASISQKSMPLPLATTSSLEALKLYADGLKRGTGADSETGTELLRQAVVVDADFSMAHAELGRRYYLMGAREMRQSGEKHLAKALSLLDRLTPRERLWIQATADDARGNRQLAVRGYRAYLAQYPDDAAGWFRLGWTHMAGLSEFEPAIDAFQRAVALRPSDSSSLVNVATCYAGLGKYAEAIEAYRKAFAVDPALLTEPYINHEYGFALVGHGDLEAAGEVFDKMAAQPEPTKKARAHRSRAFLEMYRGRYGAAINELRQAIVINTSLRATISEFRDRLILTSALEAKGKKLEADIELAAVDRLIGGMQLGPEWLRFPAAIYARRGDIGRARRLVDLMIKTSGAATADSAMNRNVAQDESHVGHARGELALAEGKYKEAVGILERARVGAFDLQIVDALAAAQLAAGSLEAAAKTYEEVVANQELGHEAQELWLRAHLSLGDVNQRLGRHEAARKPYVQLAELWKGGDSDLVALRDVNSRLGR
jgi:tetratricopeptide (TPR) repeat protein/predicted Ser/Thr protein kinase